MRARGYASRRGGFPAPQPLGMGARVLLAALLLAGLGLRLYRIDAPLVDQHAWKQTDLAGIARNYVQGGMRLAYPQIDWGGDSPGYAETEFPLLPYAAALLYRVFGEHEAIGRLLNVAASLALALLLFKYLRARVGLAAAFGALTFALFSPIAWFYGRTYLQEVAGWAFALAAVWILDRALAPEWGDPAPRRTIASALCLALALLCKLNTVIALLPMLGLVVGRRGLDGVFRPWVFTALVVAFTPPLLWYLHARGIYHQTGLTFGLVGSGHDKFQTLTFLSQLSWWREIAQRVVRMVATPPGLLLVLLGLPSLRERGARPFLWWGIAAVLLTLIVAEGSKDMAYY